MKKKNIIKKSNEITNIIEENKCKKNKYFSLYKKSNDFNNTRFAVCISTKVGKAVVRNKKKRQVKDIIDKSNLIFKSSTDYVIIIKKPVNELNYEQIKENVINLFNQILD